MIHSRFRRLVGVATALMLAVAPPLQAAQQSVYVGRAAGDHTGDALPVAFGKLNANDQELYASTASLQAQLSTLQAISSRLAALQAGTIDGVTIGGTTAAAGSFTTLNVSGALTVLGGITGALSGNASTATLAAAATKLATARTLATTGDATGSATFDGTANASLALTLATSGVSAGAYGSATAVPVLTFDAKGRATVASTTPIAIPSSAITDATAANTASTVVKRDASGNVAVGTVTGALAGNASTASTLQTARALSLSGDATGTIAFDGSAAVAIPVTLANTAVTAGSYGTATSLPAVTVDAKGRITGVALTPIAFPVTTVAGRTGAVTLSVGDVSGAAPLTSPALTGVPTVPTATAGASTTQAASTAFVTGAVASEASRAQGAEGTNATAISNETTRATGVEATLAPKARQIGVSGLATGGGDLSADRTISVPKASAAMASAGTDDTSAVTALALATPLAGKVGTGRQVLAGSGLSGGGALSSDVTVSLGAIPTLTLLSNLGASSAVPAGNTLSAILDGVVGSARGNLLVRTASGWGPLAIGSNGYTLQSNGTDPVYAPTSPGTGSVRYDVSQGLTSTQASQGRSNLTAAASGANADITALSGLTTALSIGQGGTSATTAAGARAALGLDKLTTVGDAAYTILGTDRTVVLTAALTAARTWTLPAASAMNPGAVLRLVDQVGGVSGANTLTVAASGADTIDGAASTVLVTPFNDFQLVTDGSGKWTFGVQPVARGGTGATTAAGARASLGAAASGANTDIASLAAPALGAATATTAAANDNSAKVATTGYVLGQAATASPAMDATAAVGTSTLFARQDHVHPTDTSRAPVASPTFTGTPAAPTATVDTGTTQLATTGFVLGQAASSTPLMDGTAAVGAATRYARADHVHPTDSTRAPLASPALTGVPTAPTAAAGTNTTQLATTQFVTASIAAGGGSGGSSSAVTYTPQTLTQAQKTQTRTNVLAAASQNLASFAVQFANLKATLVSLFGAWADGFNDSSGIDTTNSVNASLSSGTVVNQSADANTKALLHFDGTNGSTTFTDVAGHSFSAAGSAAISTAQSVFGGASGIFNASGATITGLSSDFTLGTGDFSIEFRVRPISTGARQYVYDGRNSGGGAGLAIWIEANGAIVAFDGVAAATIASGTTLLVSNTWYAIQVSRASGTLRIFVNGNVDATASNTTNYTSTQIRVGDYYAGGAAAFSYVDEFRFSNIARNTSAYTPVSSAFAIGSSGNLDLRSVAFAAQAAPGQCSLVLLIKPTTGSWTLNSTLTASVTRTGSFTDATAFTLQSVGTVGGYSWLEADGLDVTGQPTGTTPKYRVQTSDTSLGVAVDAAFLECN